MQWQKQRLKDQAKADPYAYVLEDCEKGCECFYDGRPGKWIGPTPFTVFGFGANGLVIVCDADLWNRDWPGKCHQKPKRVPGIAKMTSFRG
jgi:hypothetical protein